MNIILVAEMRVVLRKKFHEVNNRGTASEVLLELESLRKFWGNLLFELGI